jgi:hypothetical protein
MNLNEAILDLSAFYAITSIIAHCLMRIEAFREHVMYLSILIYATVLVSLRETARLYTTH